MLWVKKYIKDHAGVASSFHVFFYSVLLGISLWKDLRKPFNARFAQLNGLLSVLFAISSPILRLSIHYWRIFDWIYHVQLAEKKIYRPQLRVSIATRTYLAHFTSSSQNESTQNKTVHEQEPLDLSKLWNWSSCSFKTAGPVQHISRPSTDLVREHFREQINSCFGPFDWPPLPFNIIPLDFPLPSQSSKTKRNARTSQRKLDSTDGPWTTKDVAGAKIWKR